MLRYRRELGLFLPISTMGSLDKVAEEQRVDHLFLKLLDKRLGQGRNVSHHKTANSYAPKAFSDDPEGKAPGMKKAFTEAMERLFEAKKIKVEQYTRNSHPYQRIVRCSGENEE